MLSSSRWGMWDGLDSVRQWLADLSWAGWAIVRSKSRSPVVQGEARAAVHYIAYALYACHVSRNVAANDVLCRIVEREMYCADMEYIFVVDW